MAHFVAEDYNGECFILGTEGEREELVPAHSVHIFNHVGPNIAMNAAACDEFFNNQVVGLTAVVGDPNLTPLVITRIAYLRMLAARIGLYRSADNPAAHNCRYADFTIHNGNVPLPGPYGQHLIAHLPVDVRLALRAKFSNMVCCVAYMFRVRGHHYLDEFQARYSALWRKCLYQEDDPGLPWVYIARHVLHAIYPDDLDAYWMNCVQNARCSGTLIKRYNSAPAGIAGIAALRKGIDDLFMVFPTIAERNQNAIDHLEALELQVTNDRWAGSVNRRFYGGAQLVVDEALLAALAASVLGALQSFAPNSPLAQSRALARIAQNAQITQGVIAQVLLRAAEADTMVLTVVPRGNA